MLRWTQQLNWLFFLAALLSSPFQSTASTTITAQEARYDQMQQQVHKLQSQRTAQLKQIETIATQITVLKKQARRGGLFAIPARLRLPKIRAKARLYTLQMTRLTTRLYKRKQALKQARKKLIQLYRARLQLLKKQYQNEQAREMRLQIKRAYQLVNKRYQQLKTIRAYQVHLKKTPQVHVSIDPLDGPQELKQKADRIKDAEDHVSRILRTLKRKIVVVQKKLKRQKSEKKLENFVDSSDDLFNENARNPRIVTGNRTSQKMREKAKQGGILGGTKADASPKVATQNPPTGVKGGANAPAAPSRGTNDSYGNGKESAKPPSPNKTRTIQPRLQVNPSLRPGLGQINANPKKFTLDPSGTPAQQLRALKRYKMYLKRRIELLRRKQSFILQRAKRLNQERRRRRR